jgi:hypothetical protein
MKSGKRSRWSGWKSIATSGSLECRLGDMFGSNLELLVNREVLRTRLLLEIHEQLQLKKGASVALMDLSVTSGSTFRPVVLSMGFKCEIA